MKKTASLIFILALPVSLTAQVDIAGESVKRVKHSVEVGVRIHTTPKTLKNRYQDGTDTLSLATVPQHRMAAAGGNLR